MRLGVDPIPSASHLANHVVTALRARTGPVRCVQMAAHHQQVALFVNSVERERLELKANANRAEMESSQMITTQHV